MNKIKQIIILILLLLLALIGKELYNYKTISDQLLMQMNQIENKLYKQNQQNEDLKLTISNQKMTIGTLEQQIAKINSNINYIDNNNTLNNGDNEENKEPNEEEIKIIGYGLEYLKMN